MTGHNFYPFFCALALLFSFCSACSPSGSPVGYVRRTTSAANDRIMVVRSAPPTFGHQRLSALAAVYPDLGIFITQQGLPGFFAETNKGGNRYLILYYAGSRKAFACRSGEGNSRQVEFSGPYPITEKEFQTLENLRKKGDSEPSA